MKTSFSRSFFAAAIVLLSALLLVGASFQILVRNMITKQSVDELENYCETICEMASAYYTEESLTTRDFFVNLTLSTKVSGMDAVICNSAGQLVLCSDAPMGCSHQGLVLDSTYMAQVFQEGTTSKG